MVCHLQSKFAFYEYRDIVQIPGKFSLVHVLAITFQRVDDLNYDSWNNTGQFSIVISSNFNRSKNFRHGGAPSCFNLVRFLAAMVVRHLVLVFFEFPVDLSRQYLSE